ncbi:DUF4296 domain-containing protein [Flavobacterium crassostreae]|uniref:DUF4296 domain-containing protein n=1 Tax=Flavobacterium crassostreae TaxID=1763534 RepID=A0A1B9E633_9FLAO|nr:DUF4296 domain-containing protein [Flavobacterium crassostreae]OCB77387.1 hypothetical protein LPBF_05230 [Flavobacterium crassostreae]
MKKGILLIAVLFVSWSCKKELVSKPEGLIDSEKMMAIMYDLSLLDALKYETISLKDSIKIDPSGYVFKKYQIDSLQFAQSNSYYAANYIVYKEMHDAVIKRLEDKKQVVDSLSRGN